MKNFKLKDSNYLDESPWSDEEFENQLKSTTVCLV